jgi:hypothetical protein
MVLRDYCGEVKQARVLTHCRILVLVGRDGRFVLLAAANDSSLFGYLRYLVAQISTAIRCMDIDNTDYLGKH